MGDIDCDIVEPQAVCNYVTKNWAWSRHYRGCDSNDCAPGLEVGPGKICASLDCDYDDHHPMHRMMFLERSKVWACVDCGHVARPSPGDDITREAFDAMDGYRRSNDSSGGGTP